MMFSSKHATKRSHNNVQYSVQYFSRMQYTKWIKFRNVLTRVHSLMLLKDLPRANSDPLYPAWPAWPPWPAFESKVDNRKSVKEARVKSDSQVLRSADIPVPPRGEFRVLVMGNSYRGKSTLCEHILGTPMDVRISFSHPHCSVSLDSRSGRGFLENKDRLKRSGKSKYGPA
jgi:hypothetical protein